MKIQKIHWKETIPIRQQVLWPNEPPEFCHVEGDTEAYHYGAFVNEKLVSVGSVFPEGRSARLRKFATITEYQGKGIGSKLLTEVISAAKKNGISHLWCDARESALNFYSRSGMKPEGNTFLKATIPHCRLSINLR